MFTRVGWQPGAVRWSVEGVQQEWMLGIMRWGAEMEVVQHVSHPSLAHQHPLNSQPLNWEVIFHAAAVCVHDGGTGLWSIKMEVAQHVSHPSLIQQHASNLSLEMISDRILHIVRNNICWSWTADDIPSSAATVWWGFLQGQLLSGPPPLVASSRFALAHPSNP